MIRLTIPSIEDDALQAVRDVLETGYLVQGPRGADFERAIGEYLGVEHAVAVSSCAADDIAARSLTLPLYESLMRADQRRVVAELSGVMKGFGE